jgi:hypothetical protein
MTSDESKLNDPFDPAALRLDNQAFAEGMAVKKLLVILKVRRPGKQEWVRVHPDPEYRLGPVGLIELEAEREWYLTTPGRCRCVVGRDQTRDALHRNNQARGAVPLAGETARTG